MCFRDTIRDTIAENNPEALFADGWDECILGVCYNPGRGNLVVYDGDAMIDLMITRDEMSYEEAVEYFEFNIEGAWVGERTPIFLRRVAW
jgi:hypothetical protein